MDNLIEWFMNSQSPWAILFVALFWWILKQNENRETRHFEKQQTDIQKIRKEIEVLASIWKTLIDAEIERRNGK